MIIFADLAIIGKAHISINTALIRMFSENFPDDKLVFYAEKEHINFAKEKLGKARILYNGFFCPRVDQSNKIIRSLSICLKETIYVYVLLKLLILAYFNKPKYLVITSVLPITHYVLKVAKRMICPGQQILIVLHGEIESVIVNPNMYYKILNRAILKECDKLRYIVLGNSIKENIKRTFSLKDEKLISIHHPYDYNLSIIKHQEYDGPRSYTFGTIGIHNARIKHSHLIFELANLQSENIRSNRIKIKTIGVFDADMFPYINEMVDYSLSVTKEMLNSDLYAQEISTLDYILVFYPLNSYRFMASGVFFDAIKYGKPIISLNNDYIKYYFQLLGDIGYLLNNIEEMNMVIQNIVEGKENERYKMQKANLLASQKVLSQDNIKKNLFDQL